MSQGDRQISELRKTVDRFPGLPGVYLIRNEANELIYIGKARNLKKRVKSYFLGGDGRPQMGLLIQRIASIEHIVTENEQQAFVLERDLINRHKPRYNIRLKDDKSYLSIRINLNDDWPRLELVRRCEQDSALYFGPYTFGYELKALLDTINRTLPLRTCSNTVFNNRQRPCIEYQIKRCAGPCCLPVDREKYHGWVKQAISILEGKTGDLRNSLEREMQRASEDLNFEDAAAIRDRIHLLEKFENREPLSPNNGESRDAIALYREHKLATVSVLKVRNGRITDSDNYVFKDAEASDQDILEAVVEQYYSGGREIPDEILLQKEISSGDIIRTELRKERKRAPDILVPKRGVKFRLLMLAHTNAMQYFISKFDAETRYLQVAKVLARLLRLKQLPRRIECVDISNLQASDTVGAIVAFFDGEPDTSGYRRYRITPKDRPDDFAAMKEVVARRLKNGMESNDLPDLMVIDGGEGQLNAALAAREDCGVSVEMAALAKARSENIKRNMPARPERIYSEHFQGAIALKDSSEESLFLQRVRDEAHRFVIGYHRQKREKRGGRSVLDEIAGIGPERKSRLLKYYGSIRKIKDAKPEEIARAGRMPLRLADKVLRHLEKT